ncbi:MAG: hypothetical protein JHD04_16180 [Nocardioides sp.]|nr:hypothetical protein [Nocardioides sp.]
MGSWTGWRPESWVVGLAADTVIAVAYLVIVLAIVVPLVRSRQLRANRLAAATAAIFLTCAVHHGSHALHMALPSLGVDDPSGLAMRQAWDWTLSGWDVVGAVVAVHYWSLRRGFGSLMRGAQLFEDLRAREQQALELNDTVLQRMVVAQMALELGETERARAAVDSSVEAAGRIITDLLGSSPHRLDLVRSAAAGDPGGGSTGSGRVTGSGTVGGDEEQRP